MTAFLRYEEDTEQELLLDTDSDRDKDINTDMDTDTNRRHDKDSTAPSGSQVHIWSRPWVHYIVGKKSLQEM
jgi:hypothetical protein